jgi:succinyl-diaminopimelate desuccinylase
VKEICDYIDSRKKELAEFTGKLIDIPTVNPPGDNYEKIVGVLEERLKKIGLKTKRAPVPVKELKRHGVTAGSKRINLIADWHNDCAKTFMIAGHYDVVPATGNWKTNPFKAVSKNGNIYGRGSEDMKGTIASMILAVEAVKKCWIAPNVNIQAVFSPDEETGGETGFGWLVKKGAVKPDFAMSEGYSGDYVSCGNKGILWIEVELIGKSAHASRPYRGKNAFEAMTELTAELKKLKAKVQKRRTSYGARTKADSFASFVMGGMLRGPNKTNVVPDRAAFSIDRRILPEENLEAAIEEIKEVLEKFKKKNNVKVRMRITSRHEPVAVKKDSHVCRAVNSAVKYVTGKRAKQALLAGGTDMRYLISRGIPAVGYSACGGANWHGDNEYVSLKSLIDTAKVYALTVTNL